MGKLKTKKSITKRFRVTSNGKAVHRASGQGHFNGRESSNTTRAKRTDKVLAKTHTKLVIRNISK